jgi:hypothetical protein
MAGLSFTEECCTGQKQSLSKKTRRLGLNTSLFVTYPELMAGILGILSLKTNYTCYTCIFYHTSTKMKE